jgi:hypothetical protein
MAGILGIVTDERAVNPQFWADLNVMECPEDVRIETSIGGPLALGRNMLVRRFLQSRADWLLMIDDDHAVPPGFLRHLLEQPTVPILASLYLTKRPPFQPSLYGPPVRDQKTGMPAFICVFLGDFPESHGIHPVYAAGASGMLVQRVVYETLSDPWYELGQSDHVGEDLWFAHKAQQAGFPVYVDLDSRLGHLAPFAIWPDVINEQWATSIRRDWCAVAIDPAVKGSQEMRVG